MEPSQQTSLPEDTVIVNQSNSKNINFLDKKDIQLQLLYQLLVMTSFLVLVYSFDFFARFSIFGHSRELLTFLLPLVITLVLTNRNNSFSKKTWVFFSLVSVSYFLLVFNVDGNGYEAYLAPFITSGEYIALFAIHTFFVSSRRLLKFISGLFSFLFFVALILPSFFTRDRFGEKYMEIDMKYIFMLLFVVAFTGMLYFFIQVIKNRLAIKILTGFFCVGIILMFFLLYKDSSEQKHKDLKLREAKAFELKGECYEASKIYFEVSGIKTSVNACFAAKALISIDGSFCEKIVDQTEKDVCVEKLVVIKKSEEVYSLFAMGKCDEIPVTESSLTTEDCYEARVQPILSPRNTDRGYGDYYKQKCDELTTSKLRDACYIKIRKDFEVFPFNTEGIFFEKEKRIRLVNGAGWVNVVLPTGQLVRSVRVSPVSTTTLFIATEELDGSVSIYTSDFKNGEYKKIISLPKNKKYVAKSVDVVMDKIGEDAKTVEFHTISNIFYERRTNEESFIFKLINGEYQRTNSKGDLN